MVSAGRYDSIALLKYVLTSVTKQQVSLTVFLAEDPMSDISPLEAYSHLIYRTDFTACPNVFPNESNERSLGSGQAMI
jgi:hypothetical protein